MQNQDIFKYNQNLKKIFVVILGSSILFGLVVLRLQIVRFEELGFIKGTLTSIFSLIVPFSIIFKLFFTVRPWLFSNFVLGSSKILQRRGTKMKELGFGEVDKIESTFLPPLLFGGFKLTTKSGNVWFFSSALENYHLILDKIVAARPDLRTSKVLNQILPESKRVNLSWKKAQKRFQVWPLTIFKFLVIPFATTSWILKFIPNAFSEYLSTFERAYLIFIFSLITILVLQLFISMLEEQIHLKVSQKLVASQSFLDGIWVWIANQLILAILFVWILRLILN